MKRYSATLFCLLILLLGLQAPAQPPPQRQQLPYRQAGLTERQAAAHLLDRLAYGPRPGDIDRVVQMGLEHWVDQQLDGNLPDPPPLTARLKSMPAMSLSAEQLVEKYPPLPKVRQEAIQAGAVTKDDREDLGNKAYRQKLIRFGIERGYRPARELNQQLVSQKILRAVYGQNQLSEVLTDFWFNHFNVSLTDNQCRLQIFSYERDAIRPRVLGSFRGLLGATAKHPAMLLYLDNAQSTASKGATTTLDDKMEQLPPGLQTQARQKAEQLKKRRTQGINENYARELMELHTLGVDGGYTQKDVQEMARILTGWTVNPAVIGRKLPQLERAKKVGAVVDGSFLFRPDAHDSGTKVVLGRTFPAGRGLEEGEQALDLLAAHPSTARFVTGKLARWFVSDNPPVSLEKRLSATFQSSRGDMRQVMRTLIYSPEFWSAEARRSKIKSPFELAVSSLRALDAEVAPSRELYEWITDMGQPLYAYQAPTGFPDRSENWVNPGLLLTRMNFALSLASHQVPGVKFDLTRLNGGKQPDNVNQALERYARLLLPERDHKGVVALLGPKVNDPEFARKVAEADKPTTEAPMLDEEGPRRRSRKARTGPVEPVTQVVGIILGSPEFQRQ